MIRDKTQTNSDTWSHYSRWWYDILGLVVIAQSSLHFIPKKRLHSNQIERPNWPTGCISQHTAHISSKYHISRYIIIFFRCKRRHSKPSAAHCVETMKNQSKPGRKSMLPPQMTNYSLCSPERRIIAPNNVLTFLAKARITARITETSAA